MEALQFVETSSVLFPFPTYGTLFQIILLVLSIWDCFKHWDLSISSSAPTTPFELDRRMDTILETALQLASILLIKEGNLQEAANRYRTTLKPIEAKTNHYD
ncbi:hypothetical protein GQX74_011764 [Glossina fuscipes]|nr:hypothetical protein GQX74_011764 [Glossina fuscipes]